MKGGTGHQDKSESEAYLELIERVEDAGYQNSDFGIWATQSLEVKLGKVVCPGREPPSESRYQ